MDNSVKGRLNADTQRFQDLVADIKKGELKVPQFQRPFVWTDRQALDLLDSILNSYPIGSLLIWKTTEKLSAERNIGQFKLPETEELSPTYYVLDGQQRITVIYSSLGAPTEEEGFAAGFNLLEKKFQRSNVVDNPLVFPMRWTFETTKMLDFRTSLRDHLDEADREKTQQLLDDVLEAFQNYRIPVVTLKELAIAEVCPIFERINSSGTKLSIYDLMVAATWSPEFDLNTKVGVITEQLEVQGLSDVNPGAILKCLAAVHWESILKTKILNLRDLKKPELEKLVETTSKALYQTVDLLAAEFNIFNWEFIPYEALLVVLCFIHSRYGVLDAEQLGRARKWFWRASICQRYRGSSDSFLSKELELVAGFIIDGTGGVEQFGAIPSRKSLIESAFRANNSRTQAFALALSQLRPRNISNGSAIDLSSVLSSFNKKEFHHVHPRAHLKRIKDTNEHNSLVNICFLIAGENKKIRDRDPMEYIPECVAALGGDAAGVFGSNLLPLHTEFDYRTATYPEFLDFRSKIIENFLHSLCD